MKGFADKNPAETIKDIFLRNQRRNESFTRKVDKSLSKVKKTLRMQRCGNEILGLLEDCGNLLASNRIGRDIITRIAVQKFCDVLDDREEYQLRLATLFHDGWQTNNFDTYIDLQDIEARVRAATQRMGPKVDATFAILEIQAMGRDEGDGVRTYLLNVHILLRAKRGFRPKVMERKISKSVGLKCSLGARTVDISKPLKTKQDVARVVSYMLKEPALGKAWKMTPSGWRFQDTENGMHQPVCMRLAEVLSHISFPELIVASGAWTRLRHDILAMAQQSDEIRRSRCAPLPSSPPMQFWTSIPRSDVAAGWPVYVDRRPNGRKGSQPPAIPYRPTIDERRAQKALTARKRRTARSES